MLTSLISAYYYLHVVVTMYMCEGDPETANEPWLNKSQVHLTLTTLLAFQGTLHTSSAAALTVCFSDFVEGTRGFNSIM